MEIIKRGEGEFFTKEVKCAIIKDEYGLTWDADKEHCGSVLRINKDDVEYHHWSKYLMQTEGDDYLVTCPVCGCKIYLRPETLPGWLKRYAKEKSKKTV